MAELNIPIVIEGYEIIEKMKAEGRFVPVTRCAECVHRPFRRFAGVTAKFESFEISEIFDFPEGSKCPLIPAEMIMPDDFFCKYGEPKEGEK